MNTKRIKKKDVKIHANHVVKNQLALRMLPVKSEGFCICPYCFHLVFDECLTGICPCCGHRFCPSCSIRNDHN